MNTVTSDNITWHTLTADDVMNQLNADTTTGLSERDAAHRLQERGPNRLSEKPPSSRWRH